MSTEQPRTWLMITTATNLLLRMQAEITAGRREGVPRTVVVPSLLQRARACVETAIITPVVTQRSTDG